MSTILTCPDEDELLPIATGEPADEALAGHLRGCQACSERVDRLRAELTVLRQDLGDVVKPPSTAPDPAVAREGERSGGGTTLSWPSGPAGDAAPGPIGPKAFRAAGLRRGPA
jgi:hypothetical protein